MRAFISFILLVLGATPALAAEPVRIGHEHQLLLDDHLIEHSEHLTRRVQQA